MRNRVPMVPAWDPYLRFRPGEREHLVAVAECRCGERATVDDDGICGRCSRVRFWGRWLAAA